MSYLSGRNVNDVRALTSDMRTHSVTGNTSKSITMSKYDFPCEYMEGVERIFN